MKGKLYFAFLTWGLLIFFNVLSWNFLIEIRDPSWRVVFFDVGQGDSIFIRTPQNHYILIDGGPGSVVLEKLSQEMPFFQRSIDLMILTHPHDDHVSGLIEVANRYHVKDIICTGVGGESGVALRWQEVLEKEGYRVARAGQKVSGEGFYLDVLYPTERIVGEIVRDLNEVSVITKAGFYTGERFLLTGDAYKKQEEEVMSYHHLCKREEREDCHRFDLSAEVLKLGHHGSRTSTSEEFLKVVSPKVAIVMAGEDNRHGHPHEEVLEKVKRHGIFLMRTDEEGDIAFEGR